MRQTVSFPSGQVDYIFDESFESLLSGMDMGSIVLITDEHIAGLYPHLFKDIKTLVIPAGEASKDITTINKLAHDLLAAEATRNTTLVGVGGGVVTDITGLLASVYMRGLKFGFVPTTLLGVVDAAIGGKNGVNVGMNKNILGTIRQPQFILLDTRFLESLPDEEWSNGFAEIIKYACVFDKALFEELEQHDLAYYKNEEDHALGAIARRCVEWKTKTVIEDEHERGVRKLLNFGHTAAHAIENLYEIPHGRAVAVGMVIACMISEQVTGLDSKVSARLRTVLGSYRLPVHMAINSTRAMELLRMDKKRNDSNNIDYILLKELGQGMIQSLSFDVVSKALNDYENNN